MRFKLRFMNLSAFALLGALALSACDSGSPTATPIPAAPTATVTRQVPAEIPTVPSSLPTGQVPAPVPSTGTGESTPAATQGTGGTGGATPTATVQAQMTDDDALTLRPTTIETTDATSIGVFEGERSLNLPDGFQVEVYAAGLDGVRWLGLSPDGMVYATVREEGRVVTLPDADGDGTADSVNTFANELGDVHGIAFKDKGVYVANEGQIIRLEDTDGDMVADERVVIADDLPTGGGHSTRTIAFGLDGKLYVSAGSSCNVCAEEDEKRAAISLYSAEGEFERVYAAGLRNAVGMVFHPLTQELWVTNNGRDNIGNNIPPETIYNVGDGVHYGWPYCYGQQIEDTDGSVPGGAPAGFCGTTGVPSVEMQAHSAPLGLAFYYGDQFPNAYQGDLIVAFHGSWNRDEPTGYKLVRIRFKDNLPDKAVGNIMIEDFATGWRVGGDVWGRPVNPMVAPDGSLLVTDDAANAIYRIYYTGSNTP